MSIGAYMYCPICDKMEYVKCAEHPKHEIVDNVPIDYTAVAFLCPTYNEYFENNDCKKSNALRAKTAFTYYKSVYAFGAKAV